MANQDSAFGLKPVGKVGQNADNQGMSEYQIADNEASSMFQGDPVIPQASNTGFIDVAAAGNTLLGVFFGCNFTDPTTGKPTFRNHYTQTNITTGDIDAFVYDDPYERFEVQGDGASARTDIFKVADIVYATGSTINGTSNVELDVSDLEATDGQLRVIGISTDPENSDLGSANLNYIVYINDHTFHTAF